VFQHKNAFITGASSGIGAALARELAAHGANLTLVARRLPLLEALAAELGGRVKVVAAAADVTQDDGSLDAAVAAAEQGLGGIDVAIANAGFGVIGRLERLTLADYRRQLETNLFGVLRTVYATLPALKRSRGRLVMMGSVAGHVPTPSMSAYNMSKFGVRALAECLHDELRPEGVAVTLISPGFVVSDIGRVDNQGQRHDRDASAVPRWIRMPTARAARQIVTAIGAGRREAVITGHGQALVFLYRHFPWLVQAFLRAGARRGMSTRAPGQPSHES
jgi:short-subunit dehydrogenase